MADRNVGGRVEGYAIVSEDGMLADAARIMPDSLKFEADQRFFENALDRVDVVVHGRHSQEQQTRSASRRRVVVTRRIAAIAAHPANPRALLWNPAGASFDEVLSAFGMQQASVGVIGGAEVFQLFLPRYDLFCLSRAPDVFLPGGRPVFPEVPTQTPEQVLAAHGLIADPPTMLDTAAGLTMTGWKRAPGSNSAAAV